MTAINVKDARKLLGVVTRTVEIIRVDVDGNVWMDASESYVDDSGKRWVLIFGEAPKG